MPAALRRCLKDPIPEIEEAADLLKAALVSHRAGDRVSAADFLRKADMPAVREWTDSIWSKVNWVAVAHGEGWKPTLPVTREKVVTREPSLDVKNAVIARDGYMCVFCGIPVIPKKVRERVRKIYPDVVQWERPNASQHAAFQAMWLQFDHVVPHSHGGDNAEDNIVITCAPCNYGRMSKTLEDVGLLDPRTQSKRVRDWDGLVGFLEKP